MTDPDSSKLAARLFVGMQHAIPQHFLTGLVYRITRSRTPEVKNALIRSFMRGFHPDMSEALQPDPLSFASFNEFFTRALRPGCRPIDPDPATLVSPVNGAISQIGRLDGANLLQAKGHSYTLDALLDPPAAVGGAPPQWTPRFIGGSFATVYLAPFNYHRIHMPLAGTLRAAWYVPGQLFSVNTATAAAVAGLFARNERVVLLFADGERQFALVMVGALFVGSMSTVWHGDITPRRPRRRLELTADPARSPLHLEKGAELGRFNMGSTVILLLPPGGGEWLPGLKPLDPVVVGQPFARLTPRVLPAR